MSTQKCYGIIEERIPLWAPFCQYGVTSRQSNEDYRLGNNRYRRRLWRLLPGWKPPPEWKAAPAQEDAGRIAGSDLPALKAYGRWRLQGKALLTEPEASLRSPPSARGRDGREQIRLPSPRGSVVRQLKRRRNPLYSYSRPVAVEEIALQAHGGVFGCDFDCDAAFRRQDGQAAEFNVRIIVTSDDDFAPQDDFRIRGKPWLRCRRQRCLEVLLQKRFCLSRRLLVWLQRCGGRISRDGHALVDDPSLGRRQVLSRFNQHFAARSNGSQGFFKAGKQINAPAGRFVMGEEVVLVFAAVCLERISLSHGHLERSTSPCMCRGR